MDFALSILNDYGIEDVSVGSANVYISDHTNYSGVTEVGHSKADFSDFYKIVLTDSSGNTYTLSSLGDGDASLTTPAASSGNPTTPVALVYTADMSHTIVIMAVPTYNSGYAYVVDQCVYYDGALYKCIQNGTDKTPDTETAYWSEVDEDDLAEKYRVEHDFVITYNIEQALKTLVLSACDDNINEIGENFLLNKDWEKSARLSNMKDAIDYYAEDEDWEACDHIINAANTLIS